MSVSVVTSHDAIHPSDEDRIGARSRVECPGRAGRGAVPSLTVTYHSNFWPAPSSPTRWSCWSPRRHRCSGRSGRSCRWRTVDQEGHRQRVGIRIGHADAERRRGADAGGAVGRAVERRRVGDARQGRDLGRREGGPVDPGVVEQAGEPRVASLWAPSRRQFVGADGRRAGEVAAFLDAIDVQRDCRAVIGGGNVHPGRLLTGRRGMS